MLGILGFFAFHLLINFCHHFPVRILLKHSVILTIVVVLVGILIREDYSAKVLGNSENVNRSFIRGAGDPLGLLVKGN